LKVERRGILSDKLVIVRIFIRCLAWFVLYATAVHAQQPSPSSASTPALKEATLPTGVRLHYVEQGSGAPLIFVHGSLGDYTYWQGEVGPFAEKYHAIAYSRRYNYPNDNPAVSNYSAVTDADDLADLIKTLRLGKVKIIGHSYGALTGLFLAARHPEVVQAVVLAEAPAVSLLEHLSGDKAEPGRATFADIEARMVKPMQREFRAGERKVGIATFIAYVSNDPQAWEKMSPTSKKKTLRDAHEWDVMMTKGDLFPLIAPETIRKISIPVLLMSGAKSFPFIHLIDEELAQLLPHNEHFIVPDAGHQMWTQAPELCRQKAEQFLQDGH
jgi:pimeloyl-ACP methyl ester carboxylesterase